MSYQGRPCWVVKAKDFADAIRIVKPMLTYDPDSKDDGPPPEPDPEQVAKLAARTPTQGECDQFEIEALKYRGGNVELAVHPLPQFEMNRE